MSIESKKSLKEEKTVIDLELAVKKEEFSKMKKRVDMLRLKCRKKKIEK